jgi:hypothetical protein
MADPRRATEKKSASSGVTIGVIVMLVIFAVQMLSQFTYKSYGFGVTWPALIMGVGIAFVLGGLLEMGVGIMAIFGLWLAHNLEWLAFWDYWPFAILLVAVLVAVGYLRSRAAAEKEK